MTENLEQIISASRLRVRQKSPFFATLSLFAHYKPSYCIPTAATDGKDIYFNPDFLLSLSKSQQDALLLHELLHAALLHNTRRGTREDNLWNIAADIVVNGLIVEQNQFELPKGGIRKQEWEQMSVEEIYELLLKKSPDLKLPNPDLLSQPPEDCRGNSQSQSSNSSEDDSEDNSEGQGSNGSEDDSEGQPSNSSQDDSEDNSNGQGSNGSEGKGTNSKDNSNNPNYNSSEDENSLSQKLKELPPNQSDSLTAANIEQLEAHWKNAMQQAALIQRTQTHGYSPSGMERQLQEISQNQIDWRSYLWRYLIQTPNDFQGYDRRFIGRRLYLDVIAGQSVQVFVAVDTSGSIDNQDLQLFLSEVVGILGAYPHIKCELYYADADVYGPYPIDANTPMPDPQGGGGTSFIPFFEKVEENRDPNLEGVCVYLTDGYGSFPAKEPELPTLWIITPGGLSIDQIPFGEAVKLIY